MDKLHDTKVNDIVVKRQIQIEAISKAVYLVTDLFEKDEPLRLGLRRASVEIVSNSDKGQALELLQRLHSLLRIAKDIQLISEMNASLLLGAIENLDIYKEEKKQVNISHVLDTSSGVAEVEVYKVQDENVVSRIPKLMTVQPPSFPQSTGVQNVHKGQASNIREITRHEKETTVTRERSMSVSVPGMDIGSRRKKILEIVKAKGQVTINEFIDAIQGCSSKTIQRELTSLVLSGTLKKSGERRWSKYSLK